MRKRKKCAKAIASVLLVAAMVLQMIPSSVFVVKAAGSSTAIGTVENADNGIFFEYLDISEYRAAKDADGNYISCPKRDGYVFAGWYQTAAETKEVAGDTTTGSAWAKFVPEDTLSLKVQTTKKMAENPEQVKFRLVTSVDSLSYSRVGFSATINGKTKELGSQKVYRQIAVTDPENGSSITDPKTEFCQASEYFATLKISGIPKASFDSLEINATPWWITKDGTKVSGIGRSRMLASDERINDADGSGADFTVSGDNYTYKTGIGTTASYQYFKGGSDTVYLKGTYTTAGSTYNQFGITIRNGGETRQIYYNGYGVKVVKNYSKTTTGYVDGGTSTKYKNITTDDAGVYVWAQAYEGGTNIQSAVSSMIKAAAPEAHEVIWAIEKNVLYGSVDGKIFLRMPMEKLSSAWQNGRCYQLGLASYNSKATTNNMSFKLQELKFGKKAYKTADTEGLTTETEDLKTSRMAYEPIDGAYVPGSDVVDSGDYKTFARTAPKAAGTPVAVETVVENWGENDEETGVGITIVLNDDDQNSVQFEIFNSRYVRLQGEYSWQGWHFSGGAQRIEENLTKNVSVTEGKPEQASIKAAVYDGKFMVLIDGVTAYERSMTELFKVSDGSSSYSADKTVSLGVVAHDTKRGYTPRFKAVKTYEGQDAIDAKMKTWTLYPNGPYSNVNVGTGSVSDNGGTGWDSIPLVSEENRSKVWQITGTMSHSGAGDAHQGLSIETDGKWFYLMGGNEGFEKWLQSTWCSGGGDDYNGHDHAVYNNFTYSGGDNEYAFVKNSETNQYFNTWEGAGSVTFKAVIVDDTAFVWLNDVFSWMVPLDKAEFDGFDLGTNYRVKLQIGEGDRNQSFENVQVRTDSEVDATLVKNLKACKNFDWHGAYTSGQKTLSTDGVVVERGVTSDTSDVYSKVKSDTIYASASYTKKEDKAGAYGVILKGSDDRFARIALSDQGYILYRSSGWDDGRVFHTQVEGDYTLWAQNDSSAIRNMLDTKVAGTVNQIEWAVSDNTLYCKVDGQISCIIPLSHIYGEWNNTTTYSIALASWNTQEDGKLSISDLEVLFGEDAKAKLPDKATVATGLTGDNVDMVYDALDGAYIPIYKDANAALYGVAGAVVSMETDIQQQDMATADGAAAGISVRLPDSGQTAEFLIPVWMGSNLPMRTFKNLYWNEVTELPLPEGIVPFDETGHCHMSAIVADGKLVIRFNGKAAYELELASYLNGYTNGASVQIGIATNNSDEGIILFRNVKNLVGDDALAAKTTWILNEKNMDIVEENGALSIAKASPEEASATFFGKSDKWEVSGTMSQQNLSTLLAQGFEITGKNGSGQDTTVRFYGKDSGVTVVCNGGTPVTYTPGNDPYQILVNEEGDLGFYQNFFSSSARTSAEIEFRMRLAGDKLLVWFNGIQSWVIPLTRGEFGGFQGGSADYRISLFAGEGNADAAFNQVERLYGNQVQDLMTIDTSLSEEYSADESTGTVKRTGDQKSTVFFSGKSNVWEITGSMKANAVVPHGFIVRDNSSEWYIRLYGGGGSIINGNSWEYYNGDSKYMVDASCNKYFNDADKRTVTQVKFRLVLVEDTLFLWMDDVLTWRVPLTDLAFAGFEKGDLYQIGLAVNGGTTDNASDDGDIIYRGLTVKKGEEASTAGATKFEIDYNYGMNVNAQESKIEATREPGQLRHVYFRADENTNYSTKWDVTGTMRHGDNSGYDLMGFTVTDGSKKMGFSMWGNTLYVDSNGGGWSEAGWTQYTPSDTGDCVFTNNAAAAFFNSDQKKTLSFRAVIVEDVLYVYFDDTSTLNDDTLALKLPLTDSRFGGFTSGSAYQLGLCMNGGWGTEYYEDLRVKSGNAVLTLNDFRMRDVSILADDSNGEKTYYMYGTRQSYTADVFTSSDLLVWEKQGQCFDAPQDFWGVSGQLWAPEVFKYTNPDSGETAYYMMVTTSELNYVPTSQGQVIPMGVVILKADSPLGPFRQWSRTSGGNYGPVTPYADRYLDGTLYIEDGKPYMVASREHPVSWFGNEPIGATYYIPLSNDLSCALGDPVYMFNAKEGSNFSGLDGYVMDGPFMYRSNGKLFCIWSTFDKNTPSLEAKYYVLQLRSSTGKLVGGTWTYDSVAPRLYGGESDKLDGGHAMIFTDFKGQERMVLHAPNMYHNNWTTDLKERTQLLYIEYDSSIGYLRSHY